MKSQVEVQLPVLPGRWPNRRRLLQDKEWNSRTILPSHKPVRSRGRRRPSCASRVRDKLSGKVQSYVNSESTHPTERD
jgi:hypothetical protein